MAPKTPTQVLDDIMGGAPSNRVDTPSAAMAKRQEDEEGAETRWACVLPEGPRSRHEDGSLHPIFRSDLHLNAHNRRLIRCPTCGSSSVRLAEEDETDETPPEPRRDPRLLEMERAGFYATGSRRS